MASAIRLLQRFANGRQVLCFTRDDHAVRAARGLNVPVGQLTFDSEIEAASRLSARAASRPRAAAATPAYPARQAVTVTQRRSHWDAEEFPGELDDRIRTSQRSSQADNDVSISRGRPAAELDPGFGFDHDEKVDRSDRDLGLELLENDPIERAPFLSPDDIKPLHRAGITNISILITTSADALAARLLDTHITRNLLAHWQMRAQQSLQGRPGRSKGPIVKPTSRDLPRTHISGHAATDRVQGRRQREAASESGSRRGHSIDSHVVPMPANGGDMQFYLNRGDNVESAPSIGPSMAKRLEEHGVKSIADLLGANADSLSAKLGTVKGKTIRNWQRQAELACRIPQLRGHDAQILVSLGVTTAEQLAAMSAQELWSKVEPFLESTEAKRIIRGGTAPDLAEVTDWIEWSRQARSLAAA